MLDDVVREWDRWAASPRATRTIRQWAEADPALTGWTPDQLRSPRSSARTDAMQGALVALAQRDQAAAVRTLMVQLRPGLVGLTRRTMGRLGPGGQSVGSRGEAEAEVLSAFGETLVRHRLDRRPTKIAANLLLDTHQRLWRAAGREQRIGAATATASAARSNLAYQPECRPEQHPELATDALELVAAVAAALHQLTGTEKNRRLTAELAYRAWILDEPSAGIARELGLERKMVDTRLCRLRSSLRRARIDRFGYAPELVSRSDGSAPPSSPVGPSLASRQ